MFLIKNQLRNLVANSILILLTLYSAYLFALPTDNEEKMHIVSDSSVYDYKTGMKVYEGNVQINQGSTHLNADKVTTQNNHKTHRIEEAIAYGTQKLAEFTTTPNQGEPFLHAKAKKIRFNPTTRIITLEGDVIVTQGENSFHGPLIVYNMTEQTVTAPASKSGRATFVIEPKHTL